MKVIETADAPKPVGPYSQAIDAGDFIFLSGQIPIDPKTNEVCLYNGDVVKQTERVLENIRAVLKAVGLSPAKVVKTAIFMTDLSQFGVVNEVYGRFFGDHRPARSTVEVSKLPKGAAVEIEAIARK